MEEIKKETTQNTQEEIKLLTFQPQQMQDEIVKLKDEVYSLIMENNMANMMITDLKLEVNRLQKRLPKSFKERTQEILLYIFGGQWIESKDE